MTGGGDVLDQLRLIATQEASIPALRVTLFVFSVLAALAWIRQRPVAALCCLGLGGSVGLGYWLVQMVRPLGLGTDLVLTRQWAQAGVNAAAKPGGMGFVVGTPPDVSMIATLPLAGLPIAIVHAVPQLSALSCLGVQLLLPLLLFRNRTTGIFAASLAVGGGLWPGVSPYGGVLRDPSAFAAAMLVLGLFLGVLILRPGMRRRLRRFAVPIAAGFIGMGGIGRALEGGTELGVTVSLFLVAASITMALPLRGFLRKASPSQAALRRVEALVLLATSTGSGLFWWNPALTVPGFVEARDHDAALEAPLDWIRRHVPPGSVVLSSPGYSASIAALAGRRVLFPLPTETTTGRPLPEPFRRTRLFESALLGQPIARLAGSFSATHLFLGPGEATPPSEAESKATGEPRLTLVAAYSDVKDFRIFLLTKK